jgi:hypothetical protein
MPKCDVCASKMSKMTKTTMPKASGKMPPALVARLMRMSK